MSQISKIIEEIKPKVAEATQEATNLMLDEALKLLTPEQLTTLKNNIIKICPEAAGPSTTDGRAVTYQLWLLIKQKICC